MSTLGELRARFRAMALDRRVNGRDIDLLLGDALGKPLPYLLAHDEDPLEPAVEARFERSVNRRFAGEPVQYIRGHAEFYGRVFRVDRRVLIPRPETELLVDSAIELAPAGARLLDVGAGSGCICVSAKLERPDLNVFAIDASYDALVLAKENAANLGATVRFCNGDLVTPFRFEFDLIVSNPPYIPVDEYEQLDREVLEFEPPLALVAGAEGLAVIDRLLEESRARLVRRGLLMMEIGFGQDALVQRRAVGGGWKVRVVRNDLAAIPRVVILERLD